MVGLHRSDVIIETLLCKQEKQNITFNVLLYNRSISRFAFHIVYSYYQVDVANEIHITKSYYKYIYIY